MKKQRIQALISLILLMTISGCGKDENGPIVTDPKETIQGKWEITERGNWPNNMISYPASEYIEYLSDSVVRVFDYDTNQFTSQGKYWFVDSLLLKKNVYIDHISNDTILVSTLPYRYEFMNYNKLRLDFQYPATIPTSIYKRIE